MMKRILILMATGLLILGINLTAMAAVSGSVVMEAYSKRILLEENAHQKLPMASTTKIMTALITLEQPDLDLEFVVDANAIKVEGSSMGLVEGDIVTLRTLAWGMMLASGNDAANAAAVRISGSIPEFAKLMNQKAASIGMNNTNFITPSGLDDENHYSTAYDMAILTVAALENDCLASIVSTKSQKLFYGSPPYGRWLTNHNKLLWRYDKAVGVKTGFTSDAGRCLVSAANSDGLTLIAVTLNWGDDFNYHQSAYEKLFSTMKYWDAAEQVERVTLRVTGGESHRVPIKVKNLGAFVTEDEIRHAKVEIMAEPFYYAPIVKGQRLGGANLLIDGKKVSYADFYADIDVLPQQTDTRSVLQRVKDFFDFPNTRGDLLE